MPGESISAMNTRTSQVRLAVLGERAQLREGPRAERERPSTRQSAASLPAQMADSIASVETEIKEKENLVMNLKVAGRTYACLLAVILLAGAWGASPAAGQQAAASPPAAGNETQSPVVKFPPGGIGLDEVVRLTLQHDPAMKHQEATVRFQDGVVQERSGPFDFTIGGNLFYDYRVSEMTENRKQSERDKRNRIADGLTNLKASADEAGRLVELLGKARESAPGAAPIGDIARVSPTVAATVQTLDALISTSDPQLRTQLLDIRRDFLDTTVRQFQEMLVTELNTYNDGKIRLANLGEAPADEVFYTGGFSLQASRLFRSGVSFQPFIDAAVDGANFRGKLRSSDYGGKGLQDLFTFHAGAGFVVPLGRGRGARAVTAGERAAVIERDAGRLALQHQGAASALVATLAYWDLRAAEEAATIASRSFEMQKKLVGLTRELIEVDELPRAELARAQAAEARAGARADEARRAVHQARVALATVMGVSSTGDDTLPKGRDPFPTPPDPSLLTDQQIAGLVDAALSHRLDLAVARRRQVAGRTLEDAARTNLRPRFDLTFSSWLTALEERSVARAIDRWVGPSAEVSLQVERPINNNYFLGQLAQRQAESRQREISAVDLERQVRLGVVQAVSSLRETVERVRQTEAAVGFYRSTIEADVERFRTGDATLIDTVLTEQHETEAQLALIAARQELARLIARLRYETGTLVVDGIVTPQQLVTVPAAPGRRP
jgi:outer membrane protein TolC